MVISAENSVPFPNMTLATIDLLNPSGVSHADALATYDSLPPVDIDFMLGRWKGSEVKTGHALDGALAATGWYGKQFINAENVHPLLFKDGPGKLFSVNPALIPFGLATLPLRHPALATAMRLLKPIYGTKHGKARLRMLDYRGKLSAAMCYDAKPINDCFRMIDDNSVLGAMDRKGESQPYFFILERDSTPVDLPIKLP